MAVIVTWAVGEPPATAAPSAEPCGDFRGRHFCTPLRRRRRWRRSSGKSREARTPRTPEIFRMSECRSRIRRQISRESRDGDSPVRRLSSRSVIPCFLSAIFSRYRIFPLAHNLPDAQGSGKMNVEGRKMRPATCTPRQSGEQLRRALETLLSFLLVPEFFPKAKPSQGTKKKLGEVRQVIKYLEACPDKPEWHPFLSVGPPAEPGVEDKPHSILDALRIVRQEERMLLDQRKMREFSSPICTTRAPRSHGNFELTHLLYVADLVRAVLYPQEPGFRFWKRTVKEKGLPLTARAIIKRVQDFRRTAPHCRNIVTMKLHQCKVVLLSTIAPEVVAAYLKADSKGRSHQRAYQGYKYALAWTKFDGRILRALLDADRQLEAQARDRKEAGEERRRRARGMLLSGADSR